MIVIKTQQEPSTRVLLRLIEAIRYGKLYEELEYLKSLEKPLGKTKVIK